VLQVFSPELGSATVSHIVDVVEGLVGTVDVDDGEEREDSICVLC